MGQIHVLDDHLANQIAAGEVIERPANIVKELVENSIDASSSEIRIEIIDGGLKQIRIIDNGHGMSEADANLCFSRHATSKIKDDFDLFHITSLGFRGEALPSIASIARFELKTSQGQEGYKVVYEFGKCIENTKSDARKGTDITISKIFQNVPARLKYMRSVQTEFNVIQSYVEKLALSYPNIAFVLSHQGHEVFRSKGNNQLLEVIATIYNLQTAKNMIPVDFGDDEFHISGFISKIGLSRASKNYMMVMVNHRVVKNYLTTDTINQVYRPYLASDRYPMAVLNIEIDPFLVDVNVHPAKLEVRFSKQEQLKNLLYQGLSQALKAIDQTYQASQVVPKREFKPVFENQTLDLYPTQTVEVASVQETKVEQEPEKKVVYEKSIETSVVPQIEKKAIKKHLLVKGQVRGTYIICEDNQGMYIIDQHAAKERINYEYYLDRFEHATLDLQDLLLPIVLDYRETELSVIYSKKELLSSVGIKIEPFSDHSIVVKQLPVWMKTIDEQVYIEKMIEQILTQQQLDVLALRKDAIATLSCKASVKGNTYLDVASMQSIVDDLMRCENPYVCPHGRPTMISYTDYEIEKMFKRVV